MDLGTSSIGWALIDTNQNKILDIGCRIISRAAFRQERRLKERKKTSTPNLSTFIFNNWRKVIRFNFVSKIFVTSFLIALGVATVIYIIVSFIYSGMLRRKIWNEYKR